MLAFVEVAGGRQHLAVQQVGGEERREVAEPFRRLDGREGDPLDVFEGVLRPEEVGVKSPAQPPDRGVVGDLQQGCRGAVLGVEPPHRGVAVGKRQRVGRRRLQLDVHAPGIEHPVSGMGGVHHEVHQPAQRLAEIRWCGVLLAVQAHKVVHPPAVGGVFLDERDSFQCTESAASLHCGRSGECRRTGRAEVFARYRGEQSERAGVRRFQRPVRRCEHRGQRRSGRAEIQGAEPGRRVAQFLGERRQREVRSCLCLPGDHRECERQARARRDEGRDGVWFGGHPRRADSVGKQAAGVRRSELGQRKRAGAARGDEAVQAVPAGDHDRA